MRARHGYQVLLGLFLGLSLDANGTLARADEDPTKTVPNNAKDLCEPADSNLKRASRAILAASAVARSSAPAAAVPPKRWDKTQPLKNLDRVEKRFGLGRAERALLEENGFAIASRLSFPSHTHALHEVYQSQLPVYISIDAILHAIYAANDELIADIERRHLRPLLGGIVDKLHAALPVAQASYPPEVASDLDVYLTVAQRLLKGNAAPSRLGARSAQEAAALHVHAKRALELRKVTLFGRERMIDFSQLTPRGHYAKTRAMRTFFQGAMWLSRLELNLVSRSSRSSQPGVEPNPAETPREATMALALADLAERAGVVDDLSLFDRAWGLLAGKREDVSITDLLRLRKEAGITTLSLADVPARLRAAIGNRFQRTARLHYMPQGSKVLPAIATLLGPRIVADAHATRPLVHAETSDRFQLGLADIAYGLGHDRAGHYLTEDLRRFPKLGAQLAKSRAILAAALPKEDLYSAWLGAIRALAEKPKGMLPSFMQSAAFADLRINSTVAAFGQLRHNYVLIAGQSYDEGGCEIPDGFVEPAPAVYDALIDYAARGERVMAQLDAKDRLKAQAYFARLAQILRVLRAIGDEHLANRPLSEEARRFLSMVVELVPSGTGQKPTYTGWYLDLFRKRVSEGLMGAAFIADFYTSTNLGTIAYAGVSGVRLGFFVIDVGGVPRVAVGPVARGYEHIGKLDGRLDDAASLKLPESAFRDPWARSYTAPQPRAPKLTATYAPGKGLVVVSRVPIAKATFTLIDHHRAPIRSVTVALRRGQNRVRFPGRAVERADGIGVGVDDFYVVGVADPVGEGEVKLQLE